MKLKGEVFSSDGSYAIMDEDGNDLAHVTRLSTNDDLGADEEPKHGEWRTTDEQYQEIIDRVHAAVGDGGELLAALEALASPNWAQRPSGEDARNMAAFARAALDKYHGVGA